MPDYKCILDFTVTRSEGKGKVLSHHCPLCEVAAIQKIKWSKSYLLSYPTTLRNSVQQEQRFLDGKELKETTN